MKFDNAVKKKKEPKFKAIKTTVDGITFDSKAEAIYYSQHKKDKNMTMQEKFVLLDKFKLNGKAYREISYFADFVFRNDNNEIVKVVDVKGMVLPEFRLKAKMFAARYGIQITIAKKNKRINMFEEKVI